ncbi:MAG: CHAT domain-containing protein [Acidobacteriota bacterium]|nr:CHAT domain-containing protein [Acidobacteriota bacterium]
MDNRSAAAFGGNSLTSRRTLLRRLRRGQLSFTNFETEFLDLMSADLDGAAGLIPGLKRPVRSLSSIEDARRLRLVAFFYERRSNHRLAIRWTRRAMASFQELEVAGELPHCWRLLFTSYAHLGRYGKARHYAALALAEPSLSDSERLKMLVNLGALEYRTRHYKLALQHFNRAMKLLDGSRDDKSRAVVLYNMGNVYVALNKFVEAELNFESAHALFLTLNAMNACAYVLQASGHLSLILGQYFHAENKLNQARKIYSEVGDQVGAALCDVELLKLDIRLNRCERVLNRIPGLVEAFAAKGRGLETGLIYFEGVRAALALQDVDVAEAYLERAFAIFTRERNEHQLALCTMVQGLIHLSRKEHAAAKEKIQAAVGLFRISALAELELECLFYMCRIDTDYLNRDVFQRIRKLLKKPLSLPVRIQGMRLVSDYWTARGERKRGIRSLFEAVNILEESRATIASEQLRELFFEDKAEIYETLIERLFQWKDPKVPRLIFQVIELSRSRHMTEILSRREALPPVVNRNEPLVLELHRLDLRLEQLNRRLDELSRDLKAASSEKESLLQDITSSRRDLARVKDQLGHEERLGLFYPVEFEPEQISRLLKPNHLLVMYFMAGKTLYRIEMTAEGLKTYGVPLPTGFMRDFNTMLNIVSNRINSRAGLALKLADKLGRLLVPAQTRDIEHFTFILHKDLQRFPLALLRKNGRFLLEDATISQCPNLPVFYFARPRGNSRFRKPVFFFSDKEGDPLADERNVLQKHYPRAWVFSRLGDKKIPRLINKADLIHFAGHGRFDRKQPERSYLELGGDELKLRAFARFRMDNRPFLNLASCQSGWMAMSSGNEAHGFVISAFAAGASGMMASLWEIDDRATSDWMEVFYNNMGLGLPQAYRKACLELRTRNADPYFWAGFCLLGRAR